MSSVRDLASVVRARTFDLHLGFHVSHHSTYQKTREHCRPTNQQAERHQTKACQPNQITARPQSRRTGVVRNRVSSYIFNFPSVAQSHIRTKRTLKFLSIVFFFFNIFFFPLDNCIVSLRFLSSEIRVAFPGKTPSPTVALPKLRCMQDVLVFP